MLAIITLYIMIQTCTYTNTLLYIPYIYIIWIYYSIIPFILRKYKNLYSISHSSIIHNSQKVKTTNEWIHKTGAFIKLNNIWP